MILYHLQAAPSGRLRRIDLAERLGVTASGVTRTLLPLEKTGWVARQSDAKDARVSYASLTEAGQQLLAYALASVEPLVQDLTAPHIGQANANAAAAFGAVGGNGWLQFLTA